MRISDEHLNHYGDEFVAAGIGGTFEQFLALPPAIRARKVEAARTAVRMERALPTCELHGHALVEPLHTTHHALDRNVAFRLRRAMK